MRVLKKFGGAPTNETDGSIVYETSANNYIFAPTSVAGTPITSVTFTGGAGVIVGGDTISGVSYTNGGAVTLTGATVNGPVLNFTNSTSYNSFPTTSTGLTATGGSGSGAKFDVSFSNYVSGSGYQAALTISSAGTNYVVGDTLTISGSSLPSGTDITITVTSINNIVTQTYTATQSATSGSGTGAQFSITRTGTSGAADAYVTSVKVLDGGSNYAVGNTITIPGLSVGGSTPANNVTLTVTSINVRGNAGGAPTTNTYLNVAQSSTSGSGTGATFDITRTGYVGSSAAVTTVTIKNAGTGYAATNTVTILAAAIGGTSNLVITVASVGASSGLKAASTNYVTGSAFTTRYVGSVQPTLTNIANQKSQTYTDVPVISVTGDGRGAKATVVRNTSGGISTVTVTNSGLNYNVDDLLMLPASSIGEYRLDQTQLGKTANFHAYDEDFAPYQAAAKSTANITGITAALNPSKTVDGVTLQINDLFLVANQSTASQNGVYLVTNTDATKMTLVKQTTYDGSNVQVLGGTLAKAKVYKYTATTTSFSVYNAPSNTVDMAVEGDNPGGKEVYYSLFVQYTGILTSSTGNSSWVKLGDISTKYIGSTGVHQYLIDHLPAWYFNDGSTDLSDFLALLAFHLEVYKEEIDGVFNIMSPLKTPEELLPSLLRELGSEYNQVNNSLDARKLISNLILTYSTKGSSAGLSTAADSYTGVSSEIIRGTNLLPDVNTSSFEQGVGLWNLKTTATTSATYTSNPTAVSVGYLTALNGVFSGSHAFGYNGTTPAPVSVTGFAGLTNDSGATATVSIKVGPKANLSATQGRTTLSSSITIDNSTGVMPEVNDYVVAYNPSNGTPYVAPGTKITGFNTDKSVAYLSVPTIQAFFNTSTVYFSKTATDLTGILSAYLPVAPSTSYLFSAYVNRPNAAPACAVTVGIDWIRADGTLSTSTSATLSTGSQPSTGDGFWYRASTGAVTAPVDAVYASPNIGIVSLTAGGTYYIDACQFEAGTVVSTFQEPNITTIRVPSASTTSAATISNLFGDFITYGQGPVGIPGAVRTGLTADIETVPSDPPVTPTSFAVPTIGPVVLTMPTNHGFIAGDNVTVRYDPTYTFAYGGNFNILSTTATSISYGTGFAVVASTAIPATGSVTVSNIKQYNVKVTSSTAHNAVPGHQVTTTGFGVALCNAPSTTILATPTPYSFVYSVPQNTATNTLTSTGGTAYIDFGRSGSTKITTV
jgi:phage tail-like protein